MTFTRKIWRFFHCLCSSSEKQIIFNWGKYEDSLWLLPNLPPYGTFGLWRQFWHLLWRVKLHWKSAGKCCMEPLLSFLKLRPGKCQGLKNFYPWKYIRTSIFTKTKIATFLLRDKSLGYWVGCFPNFFFYGYQLKNQRCISTPIRYGNVKLHCIVFTNTCVDILE